MTPILALSSITDIMPVYGLAVAAVVVLGILVGLGCFYYRDLPQFSLYRVRALARVCRRESIRRRVLWVPPIAMLGVIAISQLSQAVDEPDAIRQTIKYALFASGLIVVLMAVIVSCTSLPKDIETKVVFTVVTKPTTRFELVMGKIVGFAQTTFLILLFMGLCTYGYLYYQSIRLQGTVTERLNSDAALQNAAIGASLTYYKDHGLLQARVLEEADGLHQYIRLPETNAQEFTISNQQQLLAPFTVDGSRTFPAGKVPADAEAKIHIKLTPILMAKTPPPFRQISGLALPGESTGLLSPEQRATNFFGPPALSVDVMAPDETTMSNFGVINRGRPIVLKFTGDEVIATCPPQLVDAMGQSRKFYVQLALMGPNYYVKVKPDAVRIEFPLLKPGATDISQNSLEMFEPGTDFTSPDRGLLAHGRPTQGGQELTSAGDVMNDNTIVWPVGVYVFRDAREPSGDKVALEMKMGVDRHGDSASADTSVTIVRVSVRNLTTGEASEEKLIPIESNQPAFLDNLDTKYVKGGSFEVVIRNDTPGASLTLARESVSVVLGRNPFALNLVMGLFCQWLLGILAITVGVFASTFLSWPIAIVLSFVLLLGRWTIMQMADVLSAGLGAQFAQSTGVQDPNTVKVTQVTVDFMANLLRNCASYLPAIDVFGASTYVERGLTIPLADVGWAVLVLLIFGLPLLSLAYLFLRNKEVAP